MVKCGITLRSPHRHSNTTLTQSVWQSQRARCTSDGHLRSKITHLCAIPGLLRGNAPIGGCYKHAVTEKQQSIAKYLQRRSIRIWKKCSHVLENAHKHGNIHSEAVYITTKHVLLWKTSAHEWNKSFYLKYLFCFFTPWPSGDLQITPPPDKILMTPEKWDTLIAEFKAAVRWVFFHLH